MDEAGEGEFGRTRAAADLRRRLRTPSPRSPARASRMAAARPLGPEPITTARGFGCERPISGYCRRDGEETSRQQRYGIHAHRRRRMGHGRRRMGIRLGTAGRRRIDRGHPRGARRRRELDRHRGRLRPGPFRGSGGARAGRALRTGPTSSPSASGCGTSSGEISRLLKADSVRRECEASLRRLKVDAIDLYQIHWPEPDADIEEGWSDAGQAAGRRQGALDRRLQFQRGADGALPRDRARSPRCSRPIRPSRRRWRRRFCPTACGTGSASIVYSPMKIGPAHRRR